MQNVSGLLCIAHVAKYLSPPSMGRYKILGDNGHLLNFALHQDTNTASNVVSISLVILPFCLPPF